MKIFDSGRFARGACAVFAAIGALFALTACHSLATIPPGPAGPFQSGATLASVPVQSSWKITRIGSGFLRPYGVAVDKHGNVYVADTGNNVIKKVAPNGTITKIGSGFRHPQGVAVGHDGYNVYVADTSHNSVKKVAPDGTITTIGSKFTRPSGVAVDGQGNVYVAGAYSLKEVAPDGTTTTVFSPAYRYHMLGRVAVDTAANIYVPVLETGPYLHDSFIYKIAPNGKIIQLPKPRQNLGNVEGIAVDKAGDLYFSFLSIDPVVGPEVIKMPRHGPNTLVGSGYKHPKGVAVFNGDVYVADFGNNAVYKVTP